MLIVEIFENSSRKFNLSILKSPPTRNLTKIRSTTNEFYSYLAINTLIDTLLYVSSSSSTILNFTRYHRDRTPHHKLAIIFANMPREKKYSDLNHA